MKEKYKILSINDSAKIKKKKKNFLIAKGGKKEGRRYHAWLRGELAGPELEGWLAKEILLGCLSQESQP